jgi:hypothetical protein
VQCSKCEAWRVVPDEHWLRLEESADDDWFCKVRACTLAWLLVGISRCCWLPERVHRRV